MLRLDQDSNGVVVVEIPVIIGFSKIDINTCMENSPLISSLARRKARLRYWVPVPAEHLFSVVQYLVLFVYCSSASRPPSEALDDLSCWS